MLFPLITGGSLRDHVTRRKLLSNDWDEDVRPWSERQILTLFRGVLDGVRGLHRAGYAHCDIKLENILLDNMHMNMDMNENRDSNMGNNNSGRNSHFGDIEMNNHSSLGRPILMDFGSARDLVVKLTDRSTVLQLCEDAARYSTISYRAPELFDGGCRHGPLEPDIDGKIDVWSCGCLLYAMMYGASPFETEFRNDGSIKVVECTHLRVLGGNLPHVPAKRASWYGYGSEILELVEWMLTVDRAERPMIDDVYDRVENFLRKGTARGRTNMDFV